MLSKKPKPSVYIASNYIEIPQKICYHLSTNQTKGILLWERKL